MQRCAACDHFNLADADSCERCGKPLSSESADERPVAGHGGPPADSFEGRVLQTAREKGKISAIKMYREQRSCSLREAKDQVEALMAQYGVTAGASRSGSGCGSQVLAILMVITAVIRLLSA